MLRPQLRASGLRRHLQNKLTYQVLHHKGKVREKDSKCPKDECFKHARVLDLLSNSSGEAQNELSPKDAGRMSDSGPSLCTLLPAGPGSSLRFGPLVPARRTPLNHPNRTKLCKPAC